MGNKPKGKRRSRDRRQERPGLYFDGQRWYRDTGKVTRSGVRVWEPVELEEDQAQPTDNDNSV